MSTVEPVAPVEEILDSLEESVTRLDYQISTHIQQAQALGDELRELATTVKALKELMATPIVLNFELPNDVAAPAVS